jgi:hypothetical protein
VSYCLEEHGDEDHGGARCHRALLVNTSQGDRQPATVLLQRIPHDLPPRAPFPETEHAATVWIFLSDRLETLYSRIQKNRYRLLEPSLDDGDEGHLRHAEPRLFRIP